MKSHKKTKAKLSVSQGRRSPLISVLVVVAIVVVAAITVVSRQVGRAQSQTATPSQSTPDVSGRKFVTVKIGGQDVQVDSQTGKIKPLTTEEAQRLGAELKVLLNKSTDGLKAVHEADGSVSVDLEGRFQNVAVARVNDDGTVSVGCVDNRIGAARFFGIDPKLVGVEQPKSASATVTRSTSSKVASK